MIYGTGFDVLYLDRVKKMQDKFGDRFANRILTPEELKQYHHYTGQRQIEYLGGRFSAKESFSKAMGTGIGKKVNFQDVQILQDKLGKPIMTSTKFSGKIFVSISHEKDVVMTTVLLEESYFRWFLQRIGQLKW